LSTSGGISLVSLAGLKWEAGWLEAGHPVWVNATH
jgi:hypothetical protein